MKKIILTLKYFNNTLLIFKIFNNNPKILKTLNMISPRERYDPFKGRGNLFNCEADDDT